MVVNTCNSALEMQRHEVHDCKSEASRVDIVSSKLVRATQ